MIRLEGDPYSRIAIINKHLQMAEHRPRLSPEEYDLWLKFKDSPFIIDQLTLLEQECTAAGVPIEDVSHYWYKSEMFSIFAKNRSKSYEQVRDEIIAEMKGYSPEYPTIERTPPEDGHLLDRKDD